MLKNVLGLSMADIASKLVGFASDGASVMIGAVSGVATRLRGIAPRLQNIHCMAHCLQVRKILTAFNPIYLSSDISKSKRLASNLPGLCMSHYTCARAAAIGL